MLEFYLVLLWARTKNELPGKLLIYLQIQRTGEKQTDVLSSPSIDEQLYMDFLIVKRLCTSASKGCFLLSVSPKWGKRQQIDPSKITLHADWEILSAIQNAHKCCLSKQTLHHICSHQDNNTIKMALSLSPQCNVDADTLATIALCLLTSKLHVPYDLGTHIHIVFQGCTIRCNPKPTLHEKLQLPALWWYYERQMGCSSTTFDIIDWDIFHPVYHKQAKKNLQWINKFCLQNFLMGKWLHQIDSCRVIKYCSCSASTEYDDHIFQCKARSTFLQHIRKELKK